MPQKYTTLHAEQMHGVHDWNAYFGTLNVQVSCLTPPQTFTLCDLSTQFW